MVLTLLKLFLGNSVRGLSVTGQVLASGVDATTHFTGNFKRSGHSVDVIIRRHREHPP